MRGTRLWIAVGVMASAALSFAPAAFAQEPAPVSDPTIIARNILPSGQYGLPGPGATTQAELYNALTPLFDGVGPNDLFTDFKSEKLGIDTDGPTTQENVPFPGVTLIRDRFNVPHVYASTRDASIQTAGWIAAEDRGLLLQLARYDARVAVIDTPGITAIGLLSQGKSFQPSAQTESVIAQETNVLLRHGAEGRAVLRDIDLFISGINAYLQSTNSPNDPWTRNDVYAVNALKAQFLGQGGGDEGRRTQFLAALQKEHGKRKGMSIFNDLRQFRTKGTPATLDRRFHYGDIPEDPKGNVIIDPGSYEEVSTGAQVKSSSPAEEPTQSSNTLMVTDDRSNTGNPLMVGGPQIEYFYPGLVYEMDMQAPGLVWRGATSAPFPGYMLIGRGEDFANTLTSASGDIVDQYAEKLCGGSDTRYRYKGKCRRMGTFNAGTLNGDPVSFRTTVHGPVVAYATADGKRVAISSKRSTIGRETLDLLFNRKLSNGSIRTPKDFYRAANRSPQTFNSFFIDDKHIAAFTTGRLPERPKSVDPGLLTNGNGKYEWRGFIGRDAHPHDADPRDGTIVNWNQIMAPGFASADNEWGRNGSVGRVDLLRKNMRRLSKTGKFALKTLVAAMNAAGTQDIRAIDTVPLLAKLLKGSKAPSARAREMLEVLVDWNEDLGSRLDRDGDGFADHPGVAVMDGSWSRIANSFMRPRIGSQKLLDELDTLFPRFDQPPEKNQYAGWYQYFDRDIRRLLGIDQPDPFNNAYCGKGKLKACQRSIWRAIDRSGDEIAAAQGSGDPSSWREEADVLQFKPVNLETIRYTNRPSGLQQVISFDGHRPRR